MPIYDFQCPRCAHRFETLVRAGESPACPACGATDVQRQFPFSAGVSTTRTRQRNLVGARRRASSEKKDKDMAHAEYLRKHNEEHGG